MNGGERMEKTELIKVIDTQTQTIKTKNFDISFNELLDMYNNKELIISPDYQRMFRWSEEKQSMLIESLILEMPLPPVFVIEIEDGIYELIDGLQRISTYLHFRYNDIEEELKESFCNDNLKEPLELIGCDIIKELNGCTFDDLPRPVQLKLKRNFIRIEVLRKETDSNIRYHMFKRLNTGGEILSDQEVRNCTIRLLGDSFNNFIIECSKNEHFKKVIENVLEDYAVTKKDQELVLRYFALKNNLDNYKKDLNFFLTNYMEKVTTEEFPFDYESEKRTFEIVFKRLYEMYGKNAFSSLIDAKSDKYKTDLIMYLFDSFTCGLANNIDILETKSNDNLRSILKELRISTDFLKTRTGGKGNTEERISMVGDAIDKCPNV